MAYIGLKQIGIQLKQDLIGKDSHRGVTFSYSWLANQLGHFSLGFYPALLLNLLLLKVTSWDKTALISAISIASFWLLFEIYNLTKPILFNGLKIDNAYKFKPRWGNLIYDTSTDVLFFILGAFCCNLFLNFDWLIFILMAGLFIVLTVVVGKNWYKTKMYQQYAQYPIQFRLSQWNRYIALNDKEIVIEFVKNLANNKHLLIFGSMRTGKTSLGVGIANEVSIKHKACTYTTAMKLISLLHIPENEFDFTWTWREAEVLVVDDINPGKPAKEQLITAQNLIKYIDNPGFSSINRQGLLNKSVIWIVGIENDDKDLQQSWLNMLKEIGVRSNNICAINLLKNESHLAQA